MSVLAAAILTCSALLVVGSGVATATSGGPIKVYGAIGYLGNDVIYPTNDSIAYYLPLTQGSPRWQTNGNATLIYCQPVEDCQAECQTCDQTSVANSIDLAVGGNDTACGVGLDTTNDKFTVNVCDGFSLGAEDTQMTLGGYQTGYQVTDDSVNWLETSLNMSGVSSQVHVDVEPSYDVGANISTGGATGSYWDANDTLSLVSEIAYQAILAALPAPAGFAYDLLNDFTGSNADAQHVNHTSEVGDAGAFTAQSLVQWYPTSGGEMQSCTNNYCGSSNCNLWYCGSQWGYNLASESNYGMVTLDSTDLGHVGLGSLTVSGMDQVESVLCTFGCIKPTDYQGSSESISIKVAPADAIQGFVRDYSGGQGLPAVPVVIQQTNNSGGQVTDFNVVSNSIGLWRFFTSPNATYSVKVAPTTPYGSPLSGQSWNYNPLGISGANVSGEPLFVVPDTPANVGSIAVGATPDFGAEDPGNGFVYVPNFGGSTVTVIDGAVPIATLSTGSGPFWATYDSSNGYMYVSNYYAQTVSVVSGTTVLANVSVSQAPGPFQSGYDPINGYVYVPGFSSDYVAVLHGTAVVGYVQVGTLPRSATYNPSNGYVYVTVYSGGVYVLNGLSVVATLSVGTQPEWATYDPQDSYVYVSNVAAGTVSVVNGLRVIANLTAGANPFYSVYDPEDGDVYVANDGGSTVSVIHGTSSPTTVSVGSAPLLPAYDAANGYVYVPNNGASTISVLNGTSRTQTIEVGTNPHSAIYSSANLWVYTLNQNSNNVTMVGILPTLPVGSTPDFSATDPANGYVYVMNFGGSNVTVLEGDTVLANLRTGTNPFWATYDPVNEAMYVSNYGSSTVSVIENLTIVANISLPLEPGPFQSAFDGFNDWVYVPGVGGDTVAVINGTHLIANITVGSEPRSASLGFWHLIPYVCVTNFGSNTVSIIWSTSVAQTIPVMAGPVWATYNSANNYVYVSDNSGSAVSVLGIYTLPEIVYNVANLSLGVEPFYSTLCHGEIYVADEVAGEVTVLSGTSVIATLTVGSDPLMPATLQGVVFVPNSGGTTVSVIQGAAVVASIVVGSDPHSTIWTVQGGSGSVYVCNSGSQSVTVIPFSPYVF